MLHCVQRLENPETGSAGGSLCQRPLPAVGTRALVVGLGRTGLSCARFLVARGVEVAVTDTRTQPPALAALQEELPGTALFLGDFAESVFAAADLLVVSPGVALAEPRIRDALTRGAEVIGDIELFARAVTAPVIAVTGSNGKSTVTTLVGEMAQRAGVNVRAGGNLGTPALDLLADEDVALYVLELSSFQLETTHSLAPVAATVLNVSPDHMDRYDSLEDYVAAKGRIFSAAATSRVLNREDPAVMAFTTAHSACVSFGLNPPQSGDFGVRRRDGKEWLCAGEEFLLPVAALRVIGRHNIANVLAAMALAEVAGMPRAAMLAAAQAFTGLPHRMEFVAARAGVRWFNDSKATNVGAALAALDGIDARIVLIAGGDGKGADFAALRAPIASRCRGVVLLGQDAPRLSAVLGDVVPLVMAHDMDEAVALAAGLARPDDVVLLSPACASTDMFTNFEVRGTAFAAAVRGLPS